MRTGTFALFFGVAYLAAGLLGLIPAALLPPPPDAPPTQVSLLYGYLLGLFPVNVWHTAVHLALGAWGVAAWRGVSHPKTFARVLVVLYGALAVMGVIPGLNTLFGILPLHGNDVWLHAATAAIAGYFAWRSEPQAERRASGAPDRRQEEQLVAHERRTGHPDRRLPRSGSVDTQ